MLEIQCDQNRHDLHFHRTFIPVGIEEDETLYIQLIKLFQKVKILMNKTGENNLIGNYGTY